MGARNEWGLLEVFWAELSKTPAMWAILAESDGTLLFCENMY
jgi:hypothetical protein